MGSAELGMIVMIIGLGIGAQWLAWRFHLPAIVLLSVAGILSGPVFGLFDPVRDLGSFKDVLVKLAVAVILFEGGLNLRFHELKNGGRAIFRLVSLGIPLSWGLGIAACHYIAGLSMPVSMVMAAIFVVTGPTVILPLIRQARLSSRMASLLKWEGIINDPLGALLAVLVFEFFISTGGSPTVEILVGLGSALCVAVVLGTGVAFFLKLAFREGWIPEYLKVPSILCLTMVVYGLSDMVQDEAGLLAVTVFGVVLANIGLRIIHDLRRFKEHIAIFLVSTVFIVLTAGLKPEDLSILNMRSVYFFAAVLFLVRPISIWLATIKTEITTNERLLLCWIAPRGVVAASVAGLFAPRMIEAGYEDARFLVPIVFSIVLITVVFHGFSLPWVAKFLGLSSGKREGLIIVGASQWTTELATVLKEMDVPVLLVDNNWHRLRKARLRGVPSHYGEILSEASEESLDYTGMGYLLAATDNDAYNALVCNAFSGHFGQERVYQIAMDVESQKEDKALRKGSRGRIAFGENLRFETLISQYYQGWQFQKTTITKTFKFEDFLQQSGEVEPLLFLSKKGTLVFDTSGKDVKPDPGDTLLSYVKPKPAV